MLLSSTETSTCIFPWRTRLWTPCVTPETALALTPLIASTFVTATTPKLVGWEMPTTFTSCLEITEAPPPPVWLHEPICCETVASPLVLSVLTAPVPPPPPGAAAVGTATDMDQAARRAAAVPAMGTDIGSTIGLRPFRNLGYCLGRPAGARRPPEVQRAVSRPAGSPLPGPAPESRSTWGD